MIKMLCLLVKISLKKMIKKVRMGSGEEAPGKKIRMGTLT